MRAQWWIGGLVLVAVGCGDAKHMAPVSGIVKLNGKPLAGATISFEPVENDNGPNRNPTSSGGKTDENGSYELETGTGEKGALVGKHRVKISLYKQQQDPESDARHRSGPMQVDKLPARYNLKSELSYDVPPGGTTEANFDLKSP